MGTGSESSRCLSPFLPKALRFLRRRTGTGALPAAGTTAAVFGLYRRFQIDVHMVGHRRQPGEDMRELSGPFLGRAASQGRGRLPDLLHEPHEGAFDAAPPVLD